MKLVPKKVFFVQGTGYHKSELGSFELALREAGIEKFNLVKVSSILPPNCLEIPKSDGLAQIKAGQIVHTVMSKMSSNEFNSFLCASIGVAKPRNKKVYGYLSEYRFSGVGEEKSGDVAENLAAEMLASTLGIQLDPRADYNKNKEIYKLEGKIIETKNITEIATVQKEGEWCTVLAAAVFIL
jgi:arginine decarboxylase